MDAGRQAKAEPGATAFVVAVLLPLMTLDRLDRPFELFGQMVRLEEFVIWAAVAWLAWTGRRTGISKRVLVWAAPLLGWVLLSHLVNLPLHQAVPYALRYTLLIWVMWAVLRGVRGRELEPVRLALVFCAGFALAIALVQVGSDTSDRARGLLTTATVFAGYVGLLAPFALAHALRRPRAAWLWWSVTGALAIAAALSFSRAGVVAFAAGLGAVACAVWAKSPGRRRLVAGAAAMLVVALAVAVILAVMYVRPIPLDAPALEDDASRVLPAVTMTHFANLRVPIWHVGMFVIYDQPWFGIGGPSRYGPVSTSYADFFERISPYLSSYPDELERQVWRTHAHQGALQVAAQWGMPAMLAALGFIALLGWHLLKGSAHDVWALGAWGALAALVVHNMLDYTVIYLAAEAGLLLGIGAGWSADPGGGAAPE